MFLVANELDITQFNVYNKLLHTQTQGLTVHKDHLVIHKEQGFHNEPYEYLVNTYYDYVSTRYFKSLEEAVTFVLIRKELSDIEQRLDDVV